jgi:glyoxylase-like metal-dependent hydrolase (beta-lactamase superfamily II)
VYLRHADQLWEEGVKDLAPYRRTWWGWVEPFSPLEMPEVLESGGRVIRAVPAPGHSNTQTALFDEASGDVFTGDLFVSPGATAVLNWANPWKEAESLRRVAALRPRRMLTGHGPGTQSRPHRGGRTAVGGPGRRRCAAEEDRADGISKGTAQGPLPGVFDQSPVFATQFRDGGRPADAFPR